ncbi:MAG: uracil-DNA glycosylase [Ilumatobacteraceae bacterium]
MDSLPHLEADVSACRHCPRLVAWRELVAHEKRAAFRDQEYWGRGVPGFGDPQACVLVLGLAPAAHGANRTGRVFTGDRSGDFLYRAMHRVGLANQPTSVSLDDGLSLRGAWVTAVVKCAPPVNKPLPEERANCHAYLQREVELLTNLTVVICLGAFAYAAACAEFGVRPRPKFGHGVDVVAPNGLTLVCSFHPSQQNTFTGRLTETMLDAVFERAVELAAFGGRRRSNTAAHVEHWDNSDGCRELRAGSRVLDEGAELHAEAGDDR